MITDKEENLKFFIEKAEKVIEEINQQIPDSLVSSIINQKNENYFIYEEMYRNLEILNNPENLNRNEDLQDQTARTIKEINDNFIAGNILEQVCLVLQSTLNPSPTSEIKLKLLEMVTFFSSLIDKEIEMKEEIFCKQISYTIEFIQILNKLRQQLNENFLKKADVIPNDNAQG